MAKVFVIAGPTASGKSALALKLAQEKESIILNGDSLQVYRNLEILTDQPSQEIQKEIPHLLYGFLEPTKNCTVGSWLALIHAEIEKAITLNKIPLVVGGTGLYLKSLLEGFTFCPPIDPSVRKTLEEKGLSQQALYADLQDKDPALTKHIHPQDSQRTLRGLEVFYGSGKPLSYWQSQKPTPPSYEFEKILLMPPKEDIHPRLKDRIEEMFERGVLDEVRQALTISLSSSALKTIGLREIKAYLDGQQSLDQAKELMFIHTKQYAKRQRTWFRNQF